MRLDSSQPRGLQVGLDGLGTPVGSQRWLVVDVETTGLSWRDSITEIAAVVCDGRRIVDEFTSLVHPGRPIPRRITELTGIDDGTVAGADPIGPVLRGFLAWSGWGEEPAGPVLVAHNARFDLGFLTRAARASSLAWPRPRVVDTLALSRLVLPRPLVADHRLATLASHYGTPEPPDHRALSDAKATALVLMGLLDDLGALGVGDAEDIISLAPPLPRP
ncbi:exonuclease domain-containing protein [Actinomyces sp. B33]|uniref:3'-5' exonuclease n=1 Tax=Actinomyces sp. B33 TaxID=2942131 RepID=UPI0023417B2C|nr:exonuclease domain-containing protein [Actinomyces sp. B33]MDC4232937.1 exonuclease domain-containing protein [Actinomyces sp. B33]